MELDPVLGYEGFVFQEIRRRSSPDCWPFVGLLDKASSSSLADVIALISSSPSHTVDSCSATLQMTRCECQKQLSSGGLGSPPQQPSAAAQAMGGLALRKPHIVEIPVGPLCFIYRHQPVLCTSRCLKNRTTTGAGGSTGRHNTT